MSNDTENISSGLEDNNNTCSKINYKYKEKVIASGVKLGSSSICLSINYLVFNEMKQYE
jgi:hypothetical protein